MTCTEPGLHLGPPAHTSGFPLQLLSEADPAGWPHFLKSMALLPHPGVCTPGGYACLHMCLQMCFYMCISVPLDPIASLAVTPSSGRVKEPVLPTWSLLSSAPAWGLEQ